MAILWKGLYGIFLALFLITYLFASLLGAIVFPFVYGYVLISRKISLGKVQTRSEVRKPSLSRKLREVPEGVSRTVIRPSR